MTNDASDSYIAKPASGTGPGVLVLHAWWGLNDFFKAFCRRLAQEGFIALAPDLYHGQIAATVEDAERLHGQLDENKAAAELLAAVDQLLQIPGITRRQIGVVGFSMGAFWSVWLSIKRPEDIRAVTVFYGAGEGDYTHSQAAYLGHFAETDPWEPAPGIQKMEKDLLAAGRPVSFHTYPGTGHWFFEENRPDAYRAGAAALAWGRTLVFLKNELAR